MIIRQKQNILYKDRMSHDRKSSVTTGQPSTNKYNNLINKTPLERASTEISFKGVSFNPFNLTKLKKLIYKTSRAFEFTDAMKVIDKHFGKVGQEHFEHIKASPTLVNNIRMGKNAQGKEVIYFLQKRPTLLVWEGLKYPFTKLPFHIADWTLKTLEKTKLFKNAEWIKNIKSGKFYATNKASLKDDEKVNSLRGLIETVNKYKYDNNKIKFSSLMNDSDKMYDPKTGNYNSVHERALNRIVSGMIPAGFLANDAYNLSSLYKNNKEDASKEKKLRFNQESKRIFSNAYIQLITLGALSKYINSSKAWIMGTIGATVLATEAYSRLSNGKKIYFISSEKAKELNEKEKKNVPSDIKAKETKPESTNKKVLSFKNNGPKEKSDLFKNFGLSANLPLFTQPPAKSSVSDDKDSKPLLSFDTVMKAAGALLVAGFALKYVNKIKLKPKNNSVKTVGELIDSKTKIVADFYKKITKKENLVSREEFNKVIAKFEEIGLGAKADFYKKVAKKQELSSIIKKIYETEIETGSTAKNIAKRFKIKEELMSIGQNKLAESLGKYNKEAILKQNFEEFISILNREGKDQLANKCKGLFLNDKGNIIDLKDPEKFKKLFAKISKEIKKDGSSEFVRPFQNVFKIDEKELNIQQFNEVIETLKNNGKADLANEYLAKINEGLTSEFIDLGKIDKVLGKQAIDFVLEPFKFAWQAITLPYRMVNRVVSAKIEIPKYDDGVSSLSNMMKKITPKVKKAEEATAKALNETAPVRNMFREDANENILKAFNKLSMSGVSNSDLSNLTRATATTATSWFLIADNYNMVMQKTNGEDKKGAKLKANERFVQEVSRMFYATLFINLFNNTFRNVYNTSLLGMSAVTAACTGMSEYFSRASIGMPVGESTKDEIQAREKANYEEKGFKGKYFKFMSKLTGKKPLSQR